MTLSHALTDQTVEGNVCWNPALSSGLLYNLPQIIKLGGAFVREEEWQWGVMPCMYPHCVSIIVLLIIDHIRGKPKWERPWIELRSAFLPVLQPGLDNTWFFVVRSSSRLRPATRVTLPEIITLPHQFFWILRSDLWVHFFTSASAQWRWVLHSLIWRLRLPPSSPQMRSSLISVSLPSCVRNPTQILNLIEVGFKMLRREIVLVYGKTLVFGCWSFIWRSHVVSYCQGAKWLHVDQHRMKSDIHWGWSLAQLFSSL